MTELKNYAATQKKGRVASPQMERTPGRSDEVKNNAGGYVFKVSDNDRLMRFLILGTDGATYYVGAKEQTKQAVKFLREQIAADEQGVVDAIVDVSVNARAYKNTPAIFALALVLCEGKDKAYARAAVNKVVRTGTHLFEFANFLDSLGGWGRAKRGAVADWYLNKSADELAYSVTKYRQREGWTHRDLLRKSHVQGVDKNVGNFILGKDFEYGKVKQLDAFVEMQAAGTIEEVLRGLEVYKNLPWEVIPTQFLKDERVWKALFYNGQLNGQALVRNITRLAKLGAFTDMQFAADYAAKLVDEDMLRRTKLHPINLLNASVVYNEGQMARSARYYYADRDKSWTTESVIADALDEAFHLSFKNVEPAGKRTMLAIDVSGSMASPAMGLDLSCAQVSAAVAMTVARTEPAHIIRGFTSSSGSYWRGNTELTDLGITARTGLANAMKSVQKNNFGGTDCSLPMMWARSNNVEVDTFVVLTDSETWAGDTKPVQALDLYKKSTGIDAKLAVFGIAGNEFSIADPSRSDMMDFVGCDANAPKVLADFSAGRI